MSESTSGDPSLLEVAVTLPVWGTYTYRDPRPAARSGFVLRNKHRPDANRAF